MEERKFYSVVLHYLGLERKAVIALDSALIDSYLTRGYIIEFVCPIGVLTEPVLD